MVITDIKLLQNGNYRITLEDKSVLTVNYEVGLSLQKGQVIDEREFDEYKKASDELRAKRRAFYILAGRDHSTKELKRKLLNSSGEAETDKAIEKMQELGLVDDEKYAKNLVSELMITRGFSLNKTKQELYKHGINRELIDMSLEEISDKTLGENAKAYDLILKKYSRYMNDDKGRKKVSSALSRAGFKWEDIKNAFRRYLEENQISDEDIFID
jgi:regulatory protein